jgi:hypothetical protein
MVCKELANILAPQDSLQVAKIIELTYNECKSNVGLVMLLASAKVCFGKLHEIDEAFSKFCMSPKGLAMYCAVIVLGIVAVPYLCQ